MALGTRIGRMKQLTTLSDIAGLEAAIENLASGRFWCSNTAVRASPAQRPDRVVEG